ncbi:carbohydrate ABC transporter permease [Paenibacillus koleovorans]|uniref:carbohydrate ABC transporter permease n=1 Tax=Paenibacillus koleovorans TaxID=121608 RepID=UPI000FDC5EDD|nr:carbohydrate ABC transporter permease [Paenibacillus koleovorans]
MIKSKTVGRALFVALMLTFAGLMLLPIVYVFNHAFKPYHELFVYPPNFLVREPTVQNFIELLWITSNSVIPLSRYLFNSLFISAVTVAAVTLASAMCAYALAKHEFPGRTFLFSSVVLMLMFAPEVVQIPRYLVVSQLGLMNTYWGHVLPMVALPVGVFLLKQFMEQIPPALLESGRIDGANELTLLLRIVIPLSMPAVATVAILAFQNSWSNLETSTFFMQDDDMKTFPFFLSTLTNNLANNVARQGAAAVAALVILVPNLIFFVILQSKVVDTMAHSGIK